MSKARDLADGTFDTDTLVVDAANNRVGIGTSSPSYNLHTVLGAGESNGVGFLNSSGQGLNFYTDTTASNADVFIDQGASGASMIFKQAGTERLRILSSGGITFNGDTAAANALSDFETGSWSPTLPQGGTVNTLYASYVKVGPLVVAYAFMTAINIPSDGNQFQIGGLPFTAASGNTYYYAGGSLSYSGSFNTNVFMDPLVQSSNTYLYFHRNDGNSSHIVNSNITGGNRDLIFQVIYHETL